jgi:hypothetical protein
MRPLRLWIVFLMACVLMAQPGWNAEQVISPGGGSYRVKAIALTGFNLK